MRYRIKITTYKDGHKEYLPQKKVLLGWMSLLYNGETTLIDFPCDRREYALEVIDKNFNGSPVVQKIEFEYINK